MTRRDRRKTLMNKRFWLRGINDTVGNESTMHLELFIHRSHEYDDDGKKQLDKPTGSIEGNVSFRDCSNHISFELYASRKHKHALRQLGVLWKMRMNLDKYITLYEKAVIELRDEGLLK